MNPLMRIRWGFILNIIDILIMPSCSDFDLLLYDMFLVTLQFRHQLHLLFLVAASLTTIYTVFSIIKYGQYLPSFQSQYLSYSFTRYFQINICNIITKNKIFISKGLGSVMANAQHSPLAIFCWGVTKNSIFNTYSFLGYSEREHLLLDEN